MVIFSGCIINMLGLLASSLGVGSSIWILLLSMSADCWFLVVGLGIFGIIASIDSHYTSCLHANSRVWRSAWQWLALAGLLVWAWRTGWVMVAVRQAWLSLFWLVAAAIVAPICMHWPLPEGAIGSQSLLLPDFYVVKWLWWNIGCSWPGHGWHWCIWLQPVLLHAVTHCRDFLTLGFVTVEIIFGTQRCRWGRTSIEVQISWNSPIHGKCAFPSGLKQVFPW